MSHGVSPTLWLWELFVWALGPEGGLWSSFWTANASMTTRYLKLAP